MDKKKKSGFLGKIFGGNKTDSCCSVEFEEVPENESDQKEETSAQDSEKSKKDVTGCGCCC